MIPKTQSPKIINSKLADAGGDGGTGPGPGLGLGVGLGDGVGAASVNVHPPVVKEQGSS